MATGFDDLFGPLPPDGQEQHYLLFYLQGLPTPQYLALTDDKGKILRQRLFRPAQEMALEAPFYWLSTRYGQEVLISLPDIDYINFLYQIERPLTSLIADSAREEQLRAQEDQREGTVDLYFRDRPQPITIRATDSVELKQMFETLSAQPAAAFPPFVRFTANDGALVAFHPERLILMVAHRGSVQTATEADYEALFGEE